MPKGRLFWRVVFNGGESASPLFASKAEAELHRDWLGQTDAKLERVRVI